DVLEPALGCGVARVAVGVEVTRELAVRLLDRGVVGVLGDAEDLVEVLLEPVLPGHRASPPSSLSRSLSRVSSCGAGRTSRCGRRWAVVTRGWCRPRGRPGAPPHPSGSRPAGPGRPPSARLRGPVCPEGRRGA